MEHHLTTASPLTLVMFLVGKPRRHSSLHGTNRIFMTTVPGCVRADSSHSFPSLLLLSSVINIGRSITEPSSLRLVHSNVQGTEAAFISINDWHDFIDDKFSSIIKEKNKMLNEF